MFRKLYREMAEVKALVASINSALIVREPGTALAAEAYDGLRRQIARAASDRQAHLVELVRTIEALDNGVSGESLRRLVEGWAEQAGLRRWEEPTPADFFEVMGEGEGPLEIVNPAWIAGDPVMLVKPGLARRAQPPEPSRSDATDDQAALESREGEA